MRTLQRTLQDYDPGFLRAVCELWGLDFPSGSARDISEIIAAAMLQPIQLQEHIDSLPEAAAEVLEFITNEGGMAPFYQVDHTFGPLREMGPGRRDREKPWRKPASPLEMIWYRGLLGRAFADSPIGPQEFIFVPSDLEPLLAPATEQTDALLGVTAEPPETVEKAASRAVDDATTLLAAFRKHPPSIVPIRSDRRSELVAFLHQPAAVDMIVQLLVEMKLLQADSLQPAPQYVGPFLESARTNALAALIYAWRDSLRWNELATLPHLQFASTDWPNDAHLSRTAAIELLRPLPIGEWWDITAFVSDVKKYHPAFQRPGGDFQSWYLQDGSGAFLNGIEHWDSVDGAYLRYLLEGPGHWLGMVDLGRSSPDSPILSFRLTPAWSALFQDSPSMNIEEPDSTIIVRSNGEVIVPRGAERVKRYQIARISAWEPPDQRGHHYRLTPGTLQAAHEQGLNTRHILQLLEKAADSELPPSVLRAVERWSQAGMEAQFKEVLLLRVHRPEILEQLSSQKTTSRYLEEILSPTTATIRPADWPALNDAAVRLGLLLEPPA